MSLPRIAMALGDTRVLATHAQPCGIIGPESDATGWFCPLTAASAHRR
jgi:hypothetical protein